MEKLYKYRAFDVNLLNMLCNSEVYYSDPTDFNDPLDCKPSLVVDVSKSELEQLCFKMFEMAYDEKRANKEIELCRYYAQEPDEADPEELEKYHCRLLSNEITRLIHLSMKGRGVLSLAGNWDSSLMWSHYAEQHKGLCLEYDLKDSIKTDSKKVDYNSSRSLLASAVIDWVYNPTPFTTADIENKYFYTKAGSWSYEEETRYLYSQGVHSAPFHLSSVYFGMRCDPSVISTVVKLLERSSRDIKCFKIYTTDGSFELLRRVIDADEIRNTNLRMSARLAFSPFLIE